MKKLLLLVSLAFLAGPLTWAQSVAPADLDRAVAYLQKTRDGVTASAAGLSTAQLAFKPGPTRWSVQEVLEHIASAEDMLMGLVRDQVMKAPARTENVNLAELDAMILRVIPDRTNKAQAPEPLIPNNRYGSAGDALKHFQESRAKTIAFLRETKDLRDHAFDNPLGQKLDAYQWILFTAAHSERHTKQILEVKADPGFPKN